MYKTNNKYVPICSMPTIDYSKMSLREELEERFRQMEQKEREEKRKKSNSPDYSNMSLREELETRFAEQEKKEKMQTMLPYNTLNFNGLSSGNKGKLQSAVEKAFVGGKGFISGMCDAGKDVYHELLDGGRSIGDFTSGLVNGFLDSESPEDRYKHTCSVPNVGYNVASSAKVLMKDSNIGNDFFPNAKYSLTNIFPSNISALRMLNRSLNGYHNANLAGNFLGIAVNALDEANCLKKNTW